MKRNLQHIDEIRFLVIHIVLINHWNINLYLSHAPYDHKIFDIWFDLTSPCLAVLSGYLFFYRTKEGFHYIKKLKTRFHSLVVPYLFWTLSFFVVYIVVKDVYARIFHSTFWYAPEEALTFKNVILNIVNPPLVNFWYLQNLVLILPFNFVIYYLLKNRYVYIAFFLLVLACYSFDLADLYFQSRFLPYYLIGCFFGYNEKYLPKIPVGKLATVLFIPAVIWIALATSFWKDNVFPLLEINDNSPRASLISSLNQHLLGPPNRGSISGMRQQQQRSSHSASPSRQPQHRVNSEISQHVLGSFHRLRRPPRPSWCSWP